VNPNLPEDHCERISNSVVPLDELVFLAAKQVVSKGVKGFSAQWARGAAITSQELDSKPPAQQQAVLGGPELKPHALVRHRLHPRCGVWHGLQSESATVPGWHASLQLVLACLVHLVGPIVLPAMFLLHIPWPAISHPRFKGLLLPCECILQP
jgi:hypothetical protein